tara:strand:- start:1329 stop:1565 length:237 start_codon:yes stop_codon:yes gene_type:complete
MTTHIRVYLFKETFEFFSKNEKIISNIASDHRVNINKINKHLNSYFTIEGKLESVHKARIIIQDIEKEFYKELNHKNS